MYIYIYIFLLPSHFFDERELTEARQHNFRRALPQEVRIITEKPSISFFCAQFSINLKLRR